jgi:tRNA(His) 5'-end guanylyltransferase
LNSQTAQNMKYPTSADIENIIYSKLYPNGVNNKKPTPEWYPEGVVVGSPPHNPKGYTPTIELVYNQGRIL